MDFFTTYYTYNFIIPPISYDNILDYNTLFDVYNEKLIFDLRDYIITYDINEGKIVTNSQLPDVSQSKLLLINNEDFIESPNAILDAKQNTKYDTIYYSPNVSNKQIVFVHNGQVDNLSKIKENIETKKLKLKNYNALKTYLKYHFLKDIEIKKTNKEIVFNKYWIGLILLLLLMLLIKKRKIKIWLKNILWIFGCWFFTPYRIVLGLINIITNSSDQNNIIGYIFYILLGIFSLIGSYLFQSIYLFKLYQSLIGLIGINFFIDIII